jgi:hypothetical protein
MVQRMQDVVTALQTVQQLHVASADPALIATAWQGVTACNDRLHAPTPPRIAKKGEMPQSVAGWYGKRFYEQTQHACIHQLTVGHTTPQLYSLERELLKCLLHPWE